MDPNTNPRVWEARYTYFLNKKRAKLEVITKIIKEQKKLNAEVVARRRNEEEQQYNIKVQKDLLPLAKMGTIMSGVGEFGKSEALTAPETMPDTQAFPSSSNL